MRFHRISHSHSTCSTGKHAREFEAYVCLFASFNITAAKFMGTKSVSMRANCMQLLIWVSVYDSGQSTVSIHRVFLFSMSFRLGKWYEARDKHTRCVWYYISFYRHWFARLSHSLRIKGVHIWTLPFESRWRFKKLATLKSQETLFRCFASSMERGGLLFTRREWKRWVINSNDGKFY